MVTGRTVDPFYVPLNVTTPAGTAIAAPLVTPAGTPWGTLLGIDLLIPPGHAGATGIGIQLAGQLILPFSRVAAWITADDFYETFGMDLEVDRGLNVLTYNVGNYPHTHYLRFKMTSTVHTPAAIAAPAIPRIVAVAPAPAVPAAQLPSESGDTPAQQAAS